MNILWRVSLINMHFDPNANYDLELELDLVWLAVPEICILSERCLAFAVKINNHWLISTTHLLSQKTTPQQIRRYRVKATAACWATIDNRQTTILRVPHSLMFLHWLIVFVNKVGFVYLKVKAKSTRPHEECWWGAHLPHFDLEPVGGLDKPLKSVTHGQCDTRPTTTFPVAGHRCPATSTKLYSLMTEVHV